MSELAGEPPDPAEQFAAYDQPAADADLARDVHEVLQPGPVPMLGQGGEICFVLDSDDRSPNGLVQHGRQRNPLPPRQVRRLAQAARGVNESGHRESDARHRQVHVVADRRCELGYPPQASLNRARLVVDCLDASGAHGSGEVDDRDRDVVDVDLDAEAGWPLRVELDRISGAPSHHRTGLSLDDQARFDEFVDQRRNGGTGEAGCLSDPGSRGGRRERNLLQDKCPVVQPYGLLAGRFGHRGQRAPSRCSSAS